MELYAVIMAGGVGSRFWPRSREKHPKQMLNIMGETTMIQQTVKRLDGFIPNENILIITSEAHKAGIIEQLPELPEENIVAEPFGRNTAACIALSGRIISRKDPEAVSIVLPADHIIENHEGFIKTLKTASDFAAKNGGLVTIGLPPTRPETGYGYIQIDEDQVSDNVYRVSTFAEKPNYSTAVRFVESGDFLWNSGMFIWKIDSIMNEIRRFLPELYQSISAIDAELGDGKFDAQLFEAYGQIRSISIDYGIMEKSQKVFLTKGDFLWSDVGSWEEVYQLSEKDENANVLEGEVFTELTRDSYIYSKGKFSAVIGADNMIIINTDDALLVCRRDQAQQVKKVVDHLKHNKLTEYL